MPRESKNTNKKLKELINFKLDTESKDSYDNDEDSKEKKIKLILKENLKSADCDSVQNCKNLNSSCKENNNCKNCGTCIIAGQDICNAPEINQSFNIVYTPIPDFNTNYSQTILTDGSNKDLGTFNYYVELSEIINKEMRLLWPVVWMVNSIIDKIKNKFTLFSGTATIKITFMLGILSNNLIKDPAEFFPILNSGNVDNVPCICNAESTASYGYSFMFNMTNTGSISGITSGTLTFIVPNNITGATFSILPSGNNSTLGGNVRPIFKYDPTFGQVLSESYGDFSPAHYLDFIPSCDHNKCETYWISVLLNGLNL